MRHPCCRRELLDRTPVWNHLMIVLREYETLGDCPRGADQRAARNFSGPGEPLLRSIRIRLWSKLLSGAVMKLRVGPGALLLILGVISPVRSPSRQPRRQRPSPPAGIDNNHQIAGVSDTASSSHAVMWSNGTMTDLGTNLIPPGCGSPSTTPPRSTTTARSSPAASTPQASSTRSWSHLASVRAQDLPPARLIHAGRSGRLRGVRDCSHHLAERTDTGGGPP